MTQDVVGPLETLDTLCDIVLQHRSMAIDERNMEIAIRSQIVQRLDQRIEAVNKRLDQQSANGEGGQEVRTANGLKNLRTSHDHLRQIVQRLGTRVDETEENRFWWLIGLSFATAANAAAALIIHWL
jgi:uncharacterized protein (DUF3084 family)